MERPDKTEELTLRLQTSTSNQKPINILLLSQLLAVLRTHTSTVKDPRLLRRLSTDIALQPVPDGLVHLLRLLRRRHLARADRPDRLIRHNNLTPVLDLICHRLQLVRHMLHCDALLPLLQSFAAAQHDPEAAVEGRLGLVSYEAVVFGEDDAALRVAEDGPCYAAVLELVNADLAREGAVGLVEDVLGGDFNALAEMFAGKEEVKGWRGDNDL
jgi:hypothetical protein